MADYQVGSLGNLISGKSDGEVGAKIVYEKVAPRAPSKKAKQSGDGMLSPLSKGISKVAGTLLRKMKPDIAGDDNKSGAMGKSWRQLPSREGDSEADGVQPNAENAFSRNAARRIHIKKNTKKHVDDPEREARTVYVGNIPYSHSRKEKLSKFFSTYGEVESVRLRCVPLKDPRMTKKLAVIKKEFHEDRSSICAYIVFKTPEGATSALQANGSVYHEYHLRVDMAANSNKKEFDSRKSVFVGNVPFSAEEEDLWQFFSECGPIVSTRIVRDPITAVSKGVAFVNFETVDGAELALHLDGNEFRKRKILVRRHRPSAKPAVEKTPSERLVRHKGENPRTDKLKEKDKKKEEIRKLKKEKRAASRVNSGITKKNKGDSNEVLEEATKTKAEKKSKHTRFVESEETTESKSELTKLDESDKPTKKKSKKKKKVEDSDQPEKNSKHLKVEEPEQEIADEPAEKKSKHVRFDEEIESPKKKKKYQGQTTDDLKKKKKRKINKGEQKKKKFAKLLGTVSQKKKKTSRT